MQYQRIKGNKKDTLKAKDLYDPVIRVSFIILIIRIIFIFS
jgi:hypothetical protein